MWESVEKTIQIIESRIDLICKTTDLYDPKYFPKKMNIFHSNIFILLENLCILKTHLSLRMGLNHIVHPLFKVYLSCKVVFIQDGRIR